MGYLQTERGFIPNHRHRLPLHFICFSLLLCIAVSNEKKKDKSSDRKRPAGFQWLQNNKQIDLSLTYYYIQVFGLEKQLPVNAKVIRKAVLIKW